MKRALLLVLTLAACAPKTAAPLAADAAPEEPDAASIKLGAGCDVIYRTCHVPTVDYDVTNKLYVDSAIAGITPTLNASGAHSTAGTPITNASVTDKAILFSSDLADLSNQRLSSSSEFTWNAATKEFRIFNTSFPLLDLTTTAMTVSVDTEVTHRLFVDDNAFLQGSVTEVDGSLHFVDLAAQNFPATLTFAGNRLQSISDPSSAQDAASKNYVDTHAVTSVTGTSPIVSSGGLTPAISLANTAVTPGSYTYASLTVDSKGRLTAASSGAAPSSTGQYVGRTVKTSGTTFTTGSTTHTLIIGMVGGGGAGGGCTSVASAVGAGGGGGAGGYAEWVVSVTPNTAYTYAIGAGGTGVSAANGNAGGNTTFTVAGNTETATGGAGGVVGTSTTTPPLYTTGNALGGVPSGGFAQVEAAGGPGEAGLALQVTSNIGSGGKGANSQFGGGAKNTTTAGTGAAAVGFGSGGGGALTGASAARTGGAGAAGVIVIDEYQ